MNQGEIMRLLGVLIPIVLIIGGVCALGHRSLEVWNTIVNTIGTFLLTGGLVYVGWKSLHLERQRYMSKLDVRLEQKEVRLEPELIIENTGEGPLVAEIKIYIEPMDENHKDKWLFDPQGVIPSDEEIRKNLREKVAIVEWKLRLRPKETRCYAYSVTRYVDALKKLGYHEYTEHQIAFEGWYRDELVPNAPQQQFLELYRVHKKDWFVNHQSIREARYNLDRLQKREDITKRLQLENYLDYLRETT